MPEMINYQNKRYKNNQFEVQMSSKHCIMKGRNVALNLSQFK